MKLQQVSEIRVNHGISGQFKEFDNYDKSIIHLPRQHLQINDV